MTFSPIPAPNYTQAPNVVYDEIAKTLKEGELRILLAIIRQTFGWHKKWDRISMKQLEIKTGMRRNAVNNSLKTLVEKGILEKRKEGPQGQEKCWYSLKVEFVKDEPEYPDNESDFIEHSNNSYQSPKETPPSLLKRPTKETLTKERKTTTLKKKEEALTSSSVVVSFLKKNEMNEKAYDSLIKANSLDKVEEAIAFYEKQRDPIANPFGWVKKCLNEGWDMSKKVSKTPQDRIKEIQGYILSNPKKEALISAKKKGVLDWGEKWIDFKAGPDSIVLFENPKAKDLIEHYIRKIGI